jgi:signal transduction histidine kinase
VPNDLPQGTKALLEVFQRLDTFDTVQQQMDGILVIATFVALVIALAAGWWIARAALRPINRIARTVRAIGDSRDLSRRLNFVGPYDEVGRLAETFDDMMDRLQRAFEAQTRFIADASHELRTPLTAIRGNADLIAKAPPEERDQCVRSIRREAERMSRLVSDLLLLAEADAEQQSIHKAEIDLDDVLSEVHRSALVLAAGKVDVRYESAEPIALFADLDRLKQVFLNLIDNAVKFTPPGGVVTIAAARDERGARISVSDTGTGIPLEEQEAIFRRFYRLEESRSQRGSGLGLSISAWIVAAHQGTIDIESEPGRGTTFTVHLPGVLEARRAERSPAQPA